MPNNVSLKGPLLSVSLLSLVGSTVDQGSLNFRLLNPRIVEFKMVDPRFLNPMVVDFHTVKSKSF